eukprot:scaffold1334_cov344-Prasinococcus_capsulatus_cf.AAC.5
MANSCTAQYATGSPATTGCVPCAPPWAGTCPACACHPAPAGGALLRARSSCLWVACSPMRRVRRPERARSRPAAFPTHGNAASLQCNVLTRRETIQYIQAERNMTPGCTTQNPQPKQARQMSHAPGLGDRAPHRSGTARRERSGTVRRPRKIGSPASALRAPFAAKRVRFAFSAPHPPR